MYKIEDENALATYYMAIYDGAIKISIDIQMNERVKKRMTSMTM